MAKRGSRYQGGLPQTGLEQIAFVFEWIRINEKNTGVRRRKMKRKGLLTLIGSIGLVFILAAPSLAQVIKLTLADQNPATGWGPVHALQPWAKKVEEATKESRF